MGGLCIVPACTKRFGEKPVQWLNSVGKKKKKEKTHQEVSLHLVPNGGQKMFARSSQLTAHTCGSIHHVSLRTFCRLVCASLSYLARGYLFGCAQQILSRECRKITNSISVGDLAIMACDDNKERCKVSRDWAISKCGMCTQCLFPHCVIIVFTFYRIL